MTQDSFVDDVNGFRISHNDFSVGIKSNIIIDETAALQAYIEDSKADNDFFDNIDYTFGNFYKSQAFVQNGFVEKGTVVKGRLQVDFR